MAQRRRVASAVNRRRVIHIRIIRRDRMWLSLVHIRSSRRDRMWLYLVREGLAALSRVAPELSACCAEVLFRTPPSQARTRRESAILATGLFEAVLGEEGPIATWRWGEGPVVLLVHGWGGHAGRLTRYVAPLTAAGFSVVAFDAPGHGDSAGRRVSLPEIARSILTVAEKFGPVVGIVAHSFGATASALAMRGGLRVERAVFLAPPANFEDYSHRFGRILRISAKITESMKKRFLERYRFRWSEFCIVNWAYSMSSSLLVFHDRGDFRVPLKDGEAIVRAWPGGELVTTRGLGHHKILRAPEVIRQAVPFLTQARRSGQTQPESHAAAV